MDTTANPTRPLAPTRATASGTPIGATSSRHDPRPSVASLFSNLWRDTTELARGEAELAKVEMSAKVSQAAEGATLLAVGGAIIYAGFLALLVAAVNALILLLPAEYAIWLAPLIVGVVVMLVGFIALSSGRRDLKARNLKPSRSMQSMRKDGQMVKEHLQ